MTKTNSKTNRTKAGNFDYQGRASGDDLAHSLSLVPSSKMHPDLLGKIGEALQKTYDPSITQSTREEYFQFLEQIKQLPDAIQIGTQLCKDFGSGNLGVYLRGFGLLLVEETVKYKWNFIDSSIKELVKGELEGLFGLFLNENLSMRMKYSRIVARVAIREWPQNWATLTELLVGPSLFACDDRLNSFEMICLIFTDLSDEVFSHFTTLLGNGGMGCFEIEEERRGELVRAISVIAERIIPQVIFTLSQLTKNVDLSKENEATCKVILNLFISSFSYSNAKLFFSDFQFISSSFSLLTNPRSSDSILNLTVELVELICCRNYEVGENTNLLFLLQHLDEIKNFSHKLCSGPPSQRTLFIRVVYFLVEFGVKQICNQRYPLKGADISDFVSFLFSICELDVIQIQAITASFWIALMKHSFWVKHSLLIQSVCSRLLKIVTAFFTLNHPKCFEKSKLFVDNELTASDFEKFYSKTFSLYCELIQCISREFPDEICNFCLPSLLSILETGGEQWDREREQKMETLLLIFENIVKGFTVMKRDEFNWQQSVQYFTFTLNRLCEFSSSQAESIYFQLASITNCLKWIFHFEIEFSFGTLYTKLFHLIYEFQDTNSFYKTRVKEKLFGVLFSLAPHITRQDAITFVQYGLQISNSGYLFPEMNTVLIDFLVTLVIETLSVNQDGSDKREVGELSGKVFELVYGHIRDASQRISLNNLTPYQFMNLIGLYLAVKRFHSAGSKSKQIKFLEGDLQACLELSWNINKLSVLACKIIQKKEKLPIDYVSQCIYSCLPSVFNLTFFLHQLAKHNGDDEFKELYLFSVPYHSKTTKSTISWDSYGRRREISESTLESYFNRFSNWYSQTKKNCYSLIAISMELQELFFSDQSILQSFFSLLSNPDQFDFYFIQCLLEGLIDKFIRTLPKQLNFLLKDQLVFLLGKMTEKCSKEWISIGDNLADDDDGEDDDDEETDFHSIKLKILINCCKKLISTWILLVGRMEVERDFGFELFLTLLTFKSDLLIGKSIDFLLIFIEKLKEKNSGGLIDEKWFDLLMERMIQVACYIEDSHTKQQIFSQIAQFVLESCLDVESFFNWLVSKTCPSNLIIITTGHLKYGQRSTMKGRKEVIRDLLRGCFDIKNIDLEQERTKFKVKNLQEKLVLNKQEVVEQENEYNLSLLFE